MASDPRQLAAGKTRGSGPAGFTLAVLLLGLMLAALIVVALVALGAVHGK